MKKGQIFVVDEKPAVVIKSLYFPNEFSIHTKDDSVYKSLINFMYDEAAKEIAFKGGGDYLIRVRLSKEISPSEGNGEKYIGTMEIAPAKQYEAKKQMMTDKEFAQYLFEWLRYNSAEDVCAKCEFCPKDDVCKHIEDERQDSDICFEGVKQYAERHKTD